MTHRQLGRGDGVDVVVGQVRERIVDMEFGQTARAIDEQKPVIGQSTENIDCMEQGWILNDQQVRVQNRFREFDRIIIDDKGEMRILTDSKQFKGIALPPDKFIVHTPHAQSGNDLNLNLVSRYFRFPAFRHYSTHP